ncbi:MAG: thioesterase family protein [Bacteroidales bacterium]|jgi:acyl-CoA thioester hydrolase|nr:thioesterase family protein [Bacteroidales bacterium]MDD3300503.1 thioesterase family protein [Bacteroidales bacterium]MDD3844084.1 thioesterase family protein [Bacteroidales bacterium]MDD4618209.1 thioesterase family protein [Bacteroidales bacterium]
MYTHETYLEVRYYETDLMGIVHHSNYIRYFECGRNQSLVDLGLPIKEVERMGIMMPVVNVTCNYKFPAYQGERLRIVSSIKELPKAKLVIDTEIFNPSGQLVCNGSVTLGFIHSDTRKPTRAPEFLINLFAPYINNE